MCASPGARCLLAPDACEWRPSTAMPCKACPSPRLPLSSKGLGWKCGQKTKNLHCFVVRLGGGRLKAGVRAAWHADIATLDDLSRAATAHLSHSPPHRSCRPRYLGQRARGLAGGNAGRAITLVRVRGDDGDEPEAGVHDAGTLEERARLRAALAMAGAGAAAPRASACMHLRGACRLGYSLCYIWLHPPLRLVTARRRGLQGPPRSAQERRHVRRRAGQC